MITPKTAGSATNPPANDPQIIGKAIIISASVININGTLQSGSSSNYSVNIGADAMRGTSTLSRAARALPRPRPMRSMASIGTSRLAI